MQTVSLSLFRFDSLGDRLWAFAQMGLARRAFAGLPGVGFLKQMGTGVGEGFTPLPNTGVYAVLAVWPSLDAAREAVGDAAVYRRYRRRAAEHWTVFLEPISARGAWDGRTPFAPAAAGRQGAGPEAEPDGSSGAGRPLAALTRATIKTRKIRAFWRHEPAISARIGQDPNVLFKLGMGETPWLRQVTFSIWPNASDMARFARAGGPHAEAIKAVRAQGFFAEELYARFEILDDWGSWEGRSPLAAHRARAQTSERRRAPRNETEASA